MVRKVEDALQAGKASLNLGNPSLADGFPTRPSYGVKGSDVVLWANYFVLDTPRQLLLQQYHISVTPAATGKKLTQVIRLLLQAPDLLPFQADIATDFRSTLISRRRFEIQEVQVEYRGEDEDEPRPGARQYTVKLDFIKVLEASALTEYLTSTNLSATYDDKLAVIQALNIFLNHYAKSAGNLATIGASKTFSLSNESDTWILSDCLIALRGFFASVRAATARVLVNVNVSHGAFYQEDRLDALIAKSGLRRDPRRLEAFLKGLRIKVTHLKDRHNKSGKVILRAKTISGVANKNDGHSLGHPPIVKGFGSGAKEVQFWLDEKNVSAGPSTQTPAGKKGGKGTRSQGKTAASGGKYISVFDHFLSTHGIRIADVTLPVINVGNRDNPSYMPAQVCHVLPGQPAKTKLGPAETQNMIRFAVRRPVENARSIVMKGRHTSGLSPDTNPRLSQFGVTVSPDLITVSARVLSPPKIVYKQNQQAQVMAGGWNLVPRNSASLKFHTGTVLQRWSCLYIEMEGNLYPRAQKFTPESLASLIGGFHSVLKDTGIAASPPLSPQQVQLSDTDDIKLDNFIKRAASSLQLLCIILPASPIPLYDRIKQLGDVKYGIHTICSVGTKIAKLSGQDQYFRNEALKLNLKLGGDNHIVSPANLALVAENKTMIVGIDVTHPSPGSSSMAPSVAGMVASINSQLGQWPGILSIQKERRQEMVSDLQSMLKSRLHLWREKGKHATLPENILVYRDGVSEGQYQKVLDEELPLLRAACREVYSIPDQSKGLPRLTIVIVETDADHRGVTEARSWDFFLQAHTALQGTARPAHYFVVLDEIFRRRNTGAGNKGKTPATTPGKNIADELQELTQSMCYVFGRATKAVSYCTPAYYADILCERARCYSKVFDPQSFVKTHGRLENTMFYI
ncbi:eukaryotic translation initiation factor 2C 2 [Durotheca rogersii]|uniref:eukaryotic translation initiation factor 2C 2 n=1 Tax=Durotheca rogersii TaxID=419775 RepID=UPI00221E45F1|nr:eukaryotic translation initiation factor 2C 2 [Durotheca rogersii]XP_051367435.1 eukaryotic translation initiation factor 2C 2 [Durotheca rogersii]KAI5854508.1 eukaryotic translation initiation factor 2C 2 [Durotheca rogersii]KAI5856652.1 eukaryotic translation initiation factor 2C 2 [Durotheca rogersii]